MFTIEQLGPQRGSIGFTKKARLLQSYYRCTIGEPCANGPRNDDGPNGSLISNGEYTGKNFLLPETFTYVKHRVRTKKPWETIAASRLYNNLLSSMPMCFNLFHPLMLLLESNPTTVVAIFNAAFPDMGIAQVEKIEIELAPNPISRYTDDKSAFDAAVFCKKTNGQNLLLAFETKYTDSLGVNAASQNQSKYEFAVELGYFNEQGLTLLQKGGGQLYRNFLLAEKHAKVHGFEDCVSIILGPKEHPDTAKELRAFYNHLKSGGKQRLIAVSLEDFTEAINKNVPSEYKEWAEGFYNRYLNFDLITPYC